jgi:Fe-S-cluster containining protein
MMVSQLPAWTAPWDVEEIPEELFDAACDALAHLPCPALDEEGACLIHELRPATCRITGMGMILPTGEILENVCPIQNQFPDYAAMAPSLFDLLGFETEGEYWDAVARTDGWVHTTIAGAVG